MKREFKIEVSVVSVGFVDEVYVGNLIADLLGEALKGTGVIFKIDVKKIDKPLFE